MRFPVFSVLSAVLAASASAEPVNPIVQHYQAYQAALGANDLARAETEATAALAASQARDGNGGHTGVLALNLAQTRLDREEIAAAREPAAQALAIAQSNAHSGVDPLIAKLVLGQSEMASDPAGGATRIRAALIEARGNSDVDVQAFAAAIVLGPWANEQRNYAAARTAWAAAIEHRNGARTNTQQARALSSIGEASALIGLDNGKKEAERMTRVSNLLREAMVGLHDDAMTPSSNNALTPVQRQYARAMAWEFTTRDIDQTAEHQFGGVYGDHECRMVTGQSSRLTGILRAMKTHYNAGVVVLRFNLDEQGRVTGARVAATAPEIAGRAEDEAVNFSIRFRRAPGEPANCVQPGVQFVGLG